MKRGEDMILQFPKEGFGNNTELHKSQLPSLLQGDIRMSRLGLNLNFELFISYNSNFFKSWAKPALDEVS